MKIPSISKILGGGRNRSADAASPADKTPYQGTLIAHGLTKTYDTRRVVNGVSLVVRRGEAVGLLGPNGAGEDHLFLHDHGPGACR